MQVFTTIFLADMQSPDTGSAEESLRNFDSEPAVFEFKPTNLEYITMLESRNWFIDELPLDD